MKYKKSKKSSKIKRTIKRHRRGVKRSKSILSKKETFTFSLAFPIYIVTTGNLVATTFGAALNIGHYSLNYINGTGAGAYTNAVSIMSNIVANFQTSGASAQFGRMSALYSLCRVKQCTLKYQSDFNWNTAAFILSAGPLSLSVRPLGVATVLGTENALYANFTYPNNLRISPINTKFSKKRVYKYPARQVQPSINDYSANSWIPTTGVAVPNLDLSLVLGMSPQNDQAIQANNTNTNTILIEANPILIGSALVDVTFEFAVPLTTS